MSIAAYNMHLNHTLTFIDSLNYIRNMLYGALAKIYKISNVNKLIYLS